MRMTRLGLIGLISVLCFNVKAQDSFIVVKEKPVSSSLPQNIYLIPLNDSSGTQAIQMSDIPYEALTKGIIFDGFRRSILWTNGGVIESINIDDNTTANIVDLSSGYFSLKIVADLALDTETGNVYFAGYRSSSSGSPPKKGIVGVIDTNGTATELYYTATDSFQDIAFDSINRLMFPVIQSSNMVMYTIKRMDLNGTVLGDIKTSFSHFVCLAIDIVDQYVLWSDGSKIYRLGYNGSNEIEFYDPPVNGGVRDMKVVDDYVYFVGWNYEEVWKVHRLDPSNVTAILESSGLTNMAYLDVPTVFGPLVTSCSVDAPANVQLPENCDQVGESCNNFTCYYGYKKNESIATLNCSASGMWNVDLSSLCKEVICSSDDIQNATLPVNCTGRVGETCDAFTCDYGYSRNPDVIALNCTESGLWSHNLSLICTETFCPMEILNGKIATDCGNKVDDACGNVTCDIGFRRTELVPEFNCTEAGEWTYNVSLLCTEVICSSADIQNATLPANCTGKVGETCDTFTCDYGYSKNPDVIDLNCTETGLWSHNLSSICTEILCNDNNIANAALHAGCTMRVGETCNSFSCNYGYERNSEIDSLNCTESGLWSYNLTTLCIEIICPGNVLNGALPGSCQSKAGESCSGYTCKTGFKKNESVTDLSCSESGEWSASLSSLCIEKRVPQKAV